MKTRLPLLPLFVLLLATPAAARDKPQPPTWDMIEMITRSWGRELTSWRVSPSGAGSWANVSVAPDRPAERAIHSFDDSSGLFEQVRRALAGLPDPAPDSARCARMITDMPYGVLRLSRGATTIEIAWNSGCQDTGYKPLLDRLRRADDLVRAVGESTPILRTEPAS